MAKLIDISPLLSSKIAQFPGYPSFSRNVDVNFEKGVELQHSTIECSLHIGAHADAPSHYHPDGQSIDQRKLAHYLGSCQIIHLPLAKSPREITLKDCKHTKIAAKRVLFRTDSFKNPNEWKENFCSLSVELIEWLVKEGVCLIGIDTPSIDRPKAKRLESHQAAFRGDLAILEGLDLSKTEERCYTLIALPLPLKDADASLVRAVLIDEPDCLPKKLSE